MNRQLEELLDELGAGFHSETPAPYDLRALCRSTGQVPTELVELPTRTQVHLLEGREAHPVTAPAAPVAGVVDGVQPPARAMAWHDGRPVALLYAAAGCLNPGTSRIETLEERLLLVASHLDGAWTRDISHGIPVVELAERYPAEIVGAIRELHWRLRHRLERLVLAAVRRPGALVVADGHIRDVAPGDGPVAGVVKSSQSQYLTDERELIAMAAGNLSKAFRLPALRDGELDRYSAYLRLHPAVEAPWTHGLVRLETNELEALDGLASWCLESRQGPGTDRRWPVHLQPVATCEWALRARVPPIL